MSEFSAAANLSVTVDDGSLRSAKREIERELGDPSMGLNVARPDGGQRAVPSGSPAAMQGQLGGVLDASQSLVDLQEETVDILENIESRIGGGGGGGGGNTLIAGGGAGGLLGQAGGLLGAAALLEGTNRLGRAGTRQLARTAPGLTGTLMQSQGFRSASANLGGFLARGPSGMATQTGQIGGQLIASETVNQLQNLQLQAPQLPQLPQLQLQLPQDVPELRLPQQIPRLELPSEADLPQIDINVPQELQQLASGNLGSIGIDVGVDIPNIRAQDIQGLEAEIRRLINNFLGSASTPRTTDDFGPFSP